MGGEHQQSFAQHTHTHTRWCQLSDFHKGVQHCNEQLLSFESSFHDAKKNCELISLAVALRKCANFIKSHQNCERCVKLDMFNGLSREVLERSRANF